MKCRAVIFDLFGTLVEEPPFAEYEKLLPQMASILGVSAEGFTRLWWETHGARHTGAFATIEANIEHVCQALGATPSKASIQHAAETRAEFACRPLRLQEGALETLRQLRADSRKIGLVSNCGPEVPPLWPQTPLAPLIDATVFSCAVGFKKPDPRIYHTACERLAVGPEQCVYVGDGDSRELTGASAVGMYAVLIRSEGSDEASHHFDPDDWDGTAISSLPELLSLPDVALQHGSKTA